MRLFAFAIVVLYSVTAVAWEVKLDTPQGWKSMYCVDVPNVGTQCRDTSSLHSGDQKLRGNEHAEITDHMLWSISDQLGEKFGVHACVTEEQADQNCPLLVDLNASYLRRNVLNDTSVAGDLQDTALEERRLAPLAMWSSVPDYGFTVYDWVNKMKLCPALPKDAQHRNLCHDYGAWLGGALNSTHFGWLPMRIYNRLHTIAMNLAAKAKAFREDLQNGAMGLPVAGLTWHREYLEEMELLALIYESVAQHYAADRWATGHMMSRWGPSTYARLPKRNGEVQLTDAVQFGILTGMLHGSQAVFGRPDPLNGPLLHSDTASELLNLFSGDWDTDNTGTLTTWRYAMDNPLSPIDQSQGGIGDLMFDALIKKSYSGVENARVDPPISLASATNQRKGLVYCTTQGLRHVIGALGENGDGYGVDELPLPSPDEAEMEFERVAGAVTLGKNPSEDPLCNSMWVTNDSWYTGLRTIAGQQTLVGDVIVVATSGDAPPGWTPPGSSLMRAGKAMVKARAIALKQVESDQLTRTDDNGITHYGTELARDSPKFRSGGFYWRGNSQEPVPNYFEPTDLDELPDLDNEFGRDKAAVYGLFNKAGTKYWCEQLPTKLEELREEVFTAAPADKDRLIATCTYLATRAYKGIEPDYGTVGPRYEAIGRHLPQGEDPKFGEEYEPICRWFESGELVFKTDDASDDSKPYFLTPGYVETPGEFGDYGPTSIENWCQQKPVMNVSVVDDRDTIFELNNTSTRWIEIRGHNLGMKTPTGAVGKVEALNDDGDWVELVIFNEQTMAAGDGWSIDNEVLYARLPLSGEGFASLAAPGQNPAAILATDATPFEIRLTRPIDPEADPMFLADGAETIGIYHVDMKPILLEVQFAAATPQTMNLRGEFCHAAWLRPQLTELAMGLYRKVGNTYTPIATPFTWYDTLPWTPDFNVVCDEEKSGVEILNPDPQVFDGNVVFVLSYH